MQQKRMAVINDLSCYGRCALTVQLPIISAMGIECCPLPTAILSANGAFPFHTITDLSSSFSKILEHWNSLSLTFDGIISGFVTSIEQIYQIEQFLKIFKSEHTLYFLDPIMGDYGKLYSVTTQEICKGYLKLFPFADVIVPNLTECCHLLSIPYPKVIPDDKTLLVYAHKLSQLGPKKIVITGIPCFIDGIPHLKNFFYEHGKDSGTISIPKIGSDRCGTGDIFLSILAGNLLKNDDLSNAVLLAARFLSQTISYTKELDIPSRNGVCFEPFLSLL